MLRGDGRIGLAHGYNLQHIRIELRLVQGRLNLAVNRHTWSFWVGLAAAASAKALSPERFPAAAYIEAMENDPDCRRGEPQWKVSVWWCWKAPLSDLPIYPQQPPVTFAG